MKDMPENYIAAQTVTRDGDGIETFRGTAVHLVYRSVLCDERPETWAALCGTKPRGKASTWVSAACDVTCKRCLDSLARSRRLVHELTGELESDRQKILSRSGRLLQELEAELPTEEP